MAQDQVGKFRIVMNAAANRREYTKRVWRDQVLGEYGSREDARAALVALRGQERRNGWEIDSGLTHEDGHSVSRRDAQDPWPRRWFASISFRIERRTGHGTWL